MSGYWSPHYWSEDYWADDYWAVEAASPAAGQSTLYVERVVEVAKFALTRKDGTGTDDFYVSLDYWGEGTLYTGNPEIYPVLAEPISTPRSVDRVMGIRHDVSISLFAKSHLNGYQKGFLDLAATYELRGSALEIRRYWRSKDGVVTHTTDNIRQTLKVIGYSISGGLLRIDARTTWFEDKEISKRLTPEAFPNLQEEFQFEYGAVVFGLGDGGVIIDAPYLSADTDNADVFTGWTFPNHPMNAVAEVFVPNPNTDIDESTWLSVTFVGDPQTPWSGDSDVGAGAGSAVGRHLSLYSRGRVVSPPTTARIIAAVACRLATPDGYWAALFNGSNNLYLEDANAFSFDAKSFGVMGWFYLENLGTQGLVGKGNLDQGTGEWFLYVNSANKPAFGFSCDGAVNAVEAVWGTALGADTYYFVHAWYDADAKTISINVNTGSTATVSTVVNSGTVAGAVSNSDSAKGYVQLANTASTTASKYNAHKLRFTTALPDGNNEDEKQIASYGGSNRRCVFENNFSPLPDTSDTYEVIAYPAAKLGDEEKKGPLQVGYIGGIGHMDGRIAHLGIYKGVIDSAHVTSIYNISGGKAYESLTDDEKAVEEEHQFVAWWDLNEFSGKRFDDHSNKDLSDAGSVGSVDGKIGAPIDPERGEIRVSVYRAKYLEGSATWAPDGPALRTTTFDPSDPDAYAFGATQFPMDPHLPISPNGNYFFMLEYTNSKEHAYSFLCDYAASVGEAHLYRLNTDENKGKAWVLESDIELSMGIYAVGNDGGFIDSSGSAPYHSHYTLEIVAANSVQEWPTMSKGVQYKFATQGLEDDGSGTYTGSANSVIRNCADVVRFVLMNADFGLGLTSSQVDTATLTSVRSAANLNLSFAIDKQTYASELLTKICVQTGLILYNSRQGKLRLHWPTYHGGTFDYELDEGRHRDQLNVLGYDNAPDREVYNDFLINFGVDPLNLPKDRAFVFRAGSNSFSANLYINGSGSNISDTNRVAKLAESQALYDKRQYRRDFDLFAANSTTALTGILRRLVDRWSVKPRRATIRVPLKDYYTVDLFDTFRTRHTALPAEGGTAKRLLWHVDGEQVIQYQDGVPTTSMGMGVIEGEVIGLSEFDQTMEITIETVEPFSSS